MAEIQPAARLDTPKKTQRDGPPDGGWGWVIVAASSLAFFITGGFARSFTLVYEQLIIKFNSSASSTAFVVALFAAVKLCSSPIVSGMVNKWGFRKVVIAGGLTSSLGMAISSFPSSITFLYISYGVVTALGTNMVITPSFVIIGQYFRKRKAMAMSLSTIGACFGGVAFPPVMEQLFHLYGYSGTMLLVSGMMLNYCVAGALYRPLKYNTDEEPPKQNGKVNNVQIVNTTKSKADCSVQMADKRYSPIFITAQRPEDKYSSRTALVERNSCVVLMYEQTKTHVCLQQQHVENKKSYKTRLQKSLLAIIGYLGFPLLRNSHLGVFIILMVGSFICMGTSNTFLSALAKESGITSMQVATMLAISSGVNIPSRFVSGLIFDQPLVCRYRQPIFAAVGFLVAVFAIAMPLSRHVIFLSACCITHCFFGSSFHSQHVTVLSDIVGRHQLASAMGLCRFFQGIGVIIGPILGGMLKDSFGEYSYAFYMGGCSLLVSTVIFQIYYMTTVTIPAIEDNAQQLQQQQQQQSH